MRNGTLGCMMSGVSRSSSTTLALVRQRTPRGRVRLLLGRERERRRRRGRRRHPGSGRQVLCRDNDNDADASVASSSAPKNTVAARIPARATAVPSYRKYGGLGLVVVFLLTGLTTTAILLWQRYRHVFSRATTGIIPIPDIHTTPRTVYLWEAYYRDSPNNVERHPRPYRGRTEAHRGLVVW